MCHKEKETKAERAYRLQQERADDVFVSALGNFVARYATDSNETGELYHVTRGLDGTVISVEGVDDVIENMRADIAALRAAFDEMKAERVHVNPNSESVTQ